VDVVTSLLEAGADMESKDENGDSPLSKASERGLIEAVTVLLEAGANMESKDKNGRSSLALASRHAHVDVVTSLLEAGADMESKDENGRSPLALASRHAHVDVVTSLLEAGADIRARDNSGLTALHTAAVHGHEAVVAVLVQAPADTNAHDNDYGSTALHFAAEYGHAAVVAALVQAGVGVDGRNNAGDTARELAERSGIGHVLARALSAREPAALTPPTWRRLFTPQARRRLAAVARFRVGGQARLHAYFERNEDAVLSAVGVDENERYDLRCPISMELMWDPVTTADGFTYERHAITEWLRHSSKSPKTNLSLVHTRLSPNTELQSRVRAMAEQGRYVLAGALQPPSG
jgi:ankyrin repeat protein